MTKYVLLSLVLASFVSVNAQSPTTADDSEGLAVMRSLAQGNGLTVGSFDTADRTTIGHPFYVDAWLPGAVFTTDGRKVTGISIRYNVADERLFVLMKKDVIDLETDLVARFTLTEPGGLVSTFIPVPAGRDRVFMRVLYTEGSTGIYERTVKKFYRGQANNDGYSANLRSRYDDKKQLWIDAGFGARKAGSSAGSVATAFGQEKNRIKAYIAKSKLDVRKPEDLTRVLEFYNSLQK